MSETTSEPEAPDVAAVETPEKTPENIQSPENPEQIETEAEKPADPPPKPRRSDRHVANLTARLAATQAELQAAHNAREAAEALLRVGKSDEAPQRPQEAPDRAAVRAEIEFDTRRQALVTTGLKELGTDAWNEKTSILHGLGATQNAAFMQALVEMPNAVKIVAELADDSDALVSLLNKSPSAMAAALGRMDAKMDAPAPKPQLSNAPRPVPKVESTAVVPEPTIFDDGLDMKSWAALWDKRQLALRGRR